MEAAWLATAMAVKDGGFKSGVRSPYWFEWKILALTLIIRLLLLRRLTGRKWYAVFRHRGEASHADRFALHLRDLLLQFLC